MQIIRSRKYLYLLEKILEYIARDNFNASIRLLKSFDKKINNLKSMPYRFRKSYHYDDENIRDSIVRGYTIPYLIDKKNNTIVILDIFKWSDRLNI